jgi:hypothetical protein
MTHSLRNNLVASLLALSIAPALANGDSNASKAVWDGHLQKVMSKNLDAVMADFTDASTILTPDKNYVGTAEIRGYIGKFIAGLTPEAMKTLAMQTETPCGDIVFTKFTVGAAKRTFVYTAEIRDGKIVTIATTNYPAE